MNEDMDAAFALVNCSQLVTLAGPKRPRVGAEMRELSIIENGAMLVRDGLVERTGTRVEIEKLVGADCEVFDAGRRVVMPGFVDAHTHTVFAGNRADEFERRAEGASYEEIAAAGGGIRSTMRRARRTKTSCLSLRSGAKSGFCGRARLRSRRSRATV